MKRSSSRLAIAACALGLGAPVAVLAQTAPGQTMVEPGTTNSATVNPKVIGPVVTADVTRIAGKITAIDPAKRVIRVEGDKGRTATIAVGPNVNNFDNLKVGDKAAVRYSQAVAIAIAKDGTGNDYKLGEIRTKIQADAARQALPGGKPGLAAVESVTTVANVFQIDREHSILTLRGTDGVPVEVKVPEQALQQIKLDDQLVTGYRQAAAIEIEPMR
ncbi:MAG: hypothetical protein H0W40_07675 [Methylibium sp.]|uniref:hypothetical protein n=1 Tax=Methylibium sp. TaxID=2067992 RepID=UPI0017C7D97F|nr:hypothetical protein [Methylibium sp.]MBA3597241.1 hypothetical protein [Methylibium sp.]